MADKIDKCHICNRYFKVEQMYSVDVGKSLYFEGHVCTKCWTKIESGTGAKEST